MARRSRRTRRLEAVHEKARDGRFTLEQALAASCGDDHRPVDARFHVDTEGRLLLRATSTYRVTVKSPVSTPLDYEPPSLPEFPSEGVHWFNVATTPTLSTLLDADGLVHWQGQASWRKAFAGACEAQIESLLAR